MPGYFYHLKLELYGHSASLKSHSSTKSTSAFVPTSDTNIFSSDLPSHRTSKWTVDALAKSHLRQPSADSSSSPSPSRPPSSGKGESPGDALLLPERNTALKEPASPALPPAKPSSDVAAKDWRFGAISIDSIDMASKEKGTPSKSQGGLHTRGVYVAAETKTTDVGWGVVHLYRDTQETPTLEDGHLKMPAGRSSTGDGQFDTDQCNTLCILAVPSWMMPSDLLGFVGDQTREDVSHFRLIRTGRANKYMVLMKFKQAKRAVEWQKAYNGRLFSAMEPENCHVVFIKSVEFLNPDSDVSEANNFPQNNIDPFTPAPRSRFKATIPSSTKPFAPPTPSLIELPTCPVCLERMDETTGLLTILCQHVFHCACLEKWRGSGCPVCRYTQSPSFTFPYPRPLTDSSEPDVEPSCSVCASEANLWICLICGNIGCGRYDSAHAYAHYESTSHCYAMDIASQHVWDYAGDGYVHRLIQNKENRQLIDLPHPNNAYRAEGDDSVPREKFESMANEYTYLLTSQLDSQRRYFEEQLERAVDKASIASQRAEEASKSARQAVTRLETMQAQTEDQNATIARLEKSMEKASLRADKFEKLARDMSKQAREEKTMNEGLLARIKVAEQTAKDKEEEVKKLGLEKAELEDMNRDLTIFISSQEKVRELQEQGEEVEMGRLSLPERPAESTGAKRKGKGRKK
ncbi:hypothetical protein MBLNU457_6680t1 [Dothideomycetes sp. NU457]